MATSLSKEFRISVEEILDIFGKKYKIVRQSPFIPDPAKPTKVIMEKKEWWVKAALIAFTEEQIKFLGVTREDLQAIVAWNPQLPENLLPGDLFVDGEREYTVVPPESVISVNGQTIAWQVVVRR